MVYEAIKPILPWQQKVYFTMAAMQVSFGAPTGTCQVKENNIILIA